MSFAYDVAGRRTSITRGNGVGSTIGYDAIGRLAGLTHDLAGTAHDVNWTYAYNPATQLTNVTRSNDLYAWTGHFNINRSYGTNGLNQLTSAGGTALGYDTRGNLTSSGSTAYTYTAENRLSSVSGAMTASYDTLGRLAEYNTSVSTRFLYDGDRVTAELDNQGAVNPVKRRYVWGAGEDELVAWYEGTNSATRRFPVQDERASIVAVSDSAGALVGINRYDEYGIPASTNIGRFQYTGQAFLAEAGLHHYKARAYSPTLGRFLQTDPIGYGDGINWYDYVGGDPVNNGDPSGLITAGSCEGDARGNVSASCSGGNVIAATDAFREQQANAGANKGSQSGPLGRSVDSLKKAGKDTLGALEKSADAVIDAVDSVTLDVSEIAEIMIPSAGETQQTMEKMFGGKNLGNLASRANELAGDVARSRGASGSNVRLMGGFAGRTLGEVGRAAAAGDAQAKTALKIVKQASRLGQKF